ncbi:MAG: CRISPR-associated protein Cas4 [Terriglobia bacterium]
MTYSSSTPNGQSAADEQSSAVPCNPSPVPYPLRVNDLKQWEYCPRIVFYNTVMPVTRKSTIKMERGKQVEIKLDALETRRTLRRYHLAEGDRRFNVSLSSERLGLSGKLDLLITTPAACYPVDFKYTRDRPRRNQQEPSPELHNAPFSTQVCIVRVNIYPEAITTKRDVKKIFQGVAAT